jgi:hypothetical protein
MAIIDWPTDRAFQGAQFSLGLDVSESTSTGFLTGNRTRRSNLVDRLTGMLTLPPCFDRRGGAVREAFMMGWRSNGDWVRMGMPHRRRPYGTLAGAPVVASAVAAGARSITLKDGNGLNLLINPSFERVALAPWTVTGGTVAAVRSVDTAFVQTYSVKLDNSTAGAGHYLGQLVPCRPSTQYTLAAFVRNNGITASALDDRSISISDLPLVAYAQDATLTTSHPLFTWTLKQVSITTGPSATHLDVRLYSPQGTVYWDAVQLTEGSILPFFEEAPTLLGGDCFGIGGNLLITSFAGAVRNATTDFLDVPLATPVQRAIAAGATVAWNAPTGLWELDADGLQLDYSAPSLQAGFAIPLRQVIA